MKRITERVANAVILVQGAFLKCHFDTFRKIFKIYEDLTDLNFTIYFVGLSRAFTGKAV